MNSTLPLSLKTKTFLERRGIIPYDWQVECYQIGRDRSLIVNAPTGSGKSLVAEMVIAEYVGDKKMCYISPTIAIGMEKYREWKRFWNVCLRCGGRSIGKEGDVWIMTPERYLKEGREFDILIADEIHTIGDDDRGAVLETILMEQSHFIGMSATIKNLEELADVFGAELYCYGVRKNDIELEYIEDDWITIVKKEVENGNSVLIFVPTIRMLKSVVRKLKDVMDECGEGIGLFDEITKHGIGFHFSRLTLEEREMMERAFNEKKLKVLVATKTLAMGVNLKSDVVMILSDKMWKDEMVSLKGMEILQMIGRAGRFGKGKAYVPYGVKLFTERVMSKLVWSKYFPLILMRYEGMVKDELVEVFKRSLFYSQYGEKVLRNAIERTIRELEMYSMIEGDVIRLTDVGKVTLRYFMVPEIVDDVLVNGYDEYEVLMYLLINEDVLRIRSNAKDLLRYKEYIPLFLKVVKRSVTDSEMAKVLKGYDMIMKWINGETVDMSEIDIDTIVRYFAGLSRLTGNERYDIMKWRMMYGVPEELVDLVKKKGVGRKKALAVLRNRKLVI